MLVPARRLPRQLCAEPDEVGQDGVRGDWVIIFEAGSWR